MTPALPSGPPALVVVVFDPAGIPLEVLPDGVGPGLGDALESNLLEERVVSLDTEGLDWAVVELEVGSLDMSAVLEEVERSDVGEVVASKLAGELKDEDDEELKVEEVERLEVPVNSDELEELEDDEDDADVDVLEVVAAAEDSDGVEMGITERKSGLVVVLDVLVVCVVFENGTARADLCIVSSHSGTEAKSIILFSTPITPQRTCRTQDCKEKCTGEYYCGFHDD